MKAVDGMMSVEEGRRLAYLASRVPSHLAIVELGSWKGRSTAFLAFGSRAGHGAHVYAVDRWVGVGNPPPAGLSGSVLRNGFQDNVRRLGLTDIVHSITGDSVEVGKTWSKDVGLLFIDANHTYEGAKADFTVWSRFLVKGGWVLLHDVDRPGPGRVVDELIVHDDRWAVADQVRTLFSAQLRAQASTKAV